MLIWGIFMPMLSREIVGIVWLLFVLGTCGPNKVSEVRGEVFRFFKEHFTDYVGSRPAIDGVIIPCLSSNEVEFLSTRFSPTKLKEVVSRFDVSKSLGPR